MLRHNFGFDIDTFHETSAENFDLEELGNGVIESLRM